ncbi:MAG TPA: hypothetical protein VI488_22230 [Candidatus Angelobacter sp.]
MGRYGGDDRIDWRLDLRRLVRRCLAAVALCAPALGGTAPAFAQDIAGAYVLLGDSDGTKPRTGAKLELTFSSAGISVHKAHHGADKRKNSSAGCSSTSGVAGQHPPARIFGQVLTAASRNRII